jgi:FkbM family methyltransferase
MMNESVRNLVRTVQVRFPALQSAKYTAKRFLTRTFRTLTEPDFAALRLFPNLQDKLFLDVGANRGQSIEDLLLVAPQGRVVSFDANGSLGQELQRIYRHNERVTVHDFGLGDTEQTTCLYVPAYRRWRFDGLASCRREEAAAALKDRIVGYRAALVTIHEVPCQIRRLDDLGLDPFFIKLDVEGYEYQVLRGAEQTLKTQRPVLMVESPGSDTIEFLATLGYDQFAFQSGQFVRGQAGERNTFFLTADKSV